MSGSPSGLIPKTNNSSLGLGASGGPRGVAAGVTQVLVNFLLNYDRGNIERLAADIKKFEADRVAANGKLTQANQRLIAIERQYTDAQKARKDAGKSQQATLNAIATTQTRINSLTQLAARNQAKYGQELTNEKAIRDRLVANVAAATGLSEKQVRQAANLASLERQATNAALERKLVAQELLTVEERIAAAKREQAAAQSVTAGIGGRLGGLAIGLIGGTIGGALVSGALLGPLQDFMDAAAQGFEDLVDPANRARDQLEAVASAVNEFSDSGNSSKFQAAVKHIQSLGNLGQGIGLDPNKLGQAAALEGVSERVEQLNKDLEVQAHLDEIVAEKTLAYAGVLAKAATAGRETSEVVTEIGDKTRLATEGGYGYTEALRGNTTALQNLANSGDPWAQSLLAQADASVRAALGLDTYSQSAEASEQAAADAAQAAQELSDELAQLALAAVSAANVSGLETALQGTIDRINAATEAGIDSIRRRAEGAADAVRNSADARIDALQKQMRSLELTPSGRTRSLERQLDALKDAGPSRATKNLADQIERLNRLQDEAAYKQSLRDVAEEKHALLLRERLRLSKEEIDLDDYKGKDRLIAIDALLERQRKANEAQDRFNKLLDIQYQIQQGVHREQGETINDFVQRRAQYYRGLLQQAAELNREGPQAELEAERDRVETQIGLKELEEKRRKIIEDRARALRLKALQEELRRSQEHDRAVLESRREHLQKQLEASRKADQAALESRRQALQDQIEAVRNAASNQIEAIQNQRDKEIAAREATRDRAIEAARKTAELAIEAEKRRADAIKLLASSAETARLTEAFKGAQSVAQLQQFAGRLSGALYALNYLQQTGQYLGLDPTVRNQISLNALHAVQTYQQKLTEFYRNTRTPPAGFAEGGFIRLNNSNTPVSGDVRWGDGQGDEYGMMILNNKIVQAIRDKGSNGGEPLIGSVVFQSEDPWRDSWRFRRTVEDVAKRVLD